MGRKLRNLVGALKDTASFAAAAATTLSPSSAAQMAVLRATPHQPADEPPLPRHIRAILSFGHGSRISAASAAGALADRLRSTRDPAVAFKCLLALHHVLARGPFILRDQLPTALLRHPTSGRNPLALSAFPLGSSPVSFALASCVRWYGRLLELLISASLLLAPFYPNPNPNPNPDPDDDRVTALLDRDLISELDLLVEIVEEMGSAPEMAAVEGNNLVAEAVRLVEADRLAAEREIEIRVREMRERTTSLGFADSVELVCVLRRLEETRHRPCHRKPTIGDWFWTGVRQLAERAEAAALREEEEKRRFRRDKLSNSARIGCRVADQSAQLVRFGSSRWFNH